jgi:hypothetical protein
MKNERQKFKIEVARKVIKKEENSLDLIFAMCNCKPCKIF